MAKMTLKGDRQKISSAMEPPQSIDAEMAVLGSIIKDPEALNSIIDFFNDPEAFYVPKHRIIYKAILNLFEKNDPCDSTTVAEELTRMNELEKIGGRTYLIDLIGGVALTPAARVADARGPTPEVAPVVVLLSEQGAVAFADSPATDLDLAAYERDLAVRAAALTPTQSLPVVIRLPERIPSGQLLEILNVSARVPAVTTSLGGREPGGSPGAATDRSKPR